MVDTLKRDRKRGPRRRREWVRISMSHHEGKAWVVAGSKSARQRARRQKTSYIDAGGLCYWCGEEMVVYLPNNPRRISIDHLDPENPQACRMFACKQCNEIRGAVRVAEYWRRLGQSAQWATQ